MKKLFVLAARDWLGGDWLGGDWLGAGSWLRVLAVVMAVAQFSGCAAVVVGGAAGAGGAMYFTGKLEDTINRPVTKVYDASLRALKQMGLPVLEHEHDSMTAKIKSLFADDKKVWIDIESVTVDTSRITVRVGLIGDEAKSRRILESIRKNL